jgi:hypothetical protein
MSRVSLGDRSWLAALQLVGYACEAGVDYPSGASADAHDGPKEFAF